MSKEFYILIGLAIVLILYCIFMLFYMFKLKKLKFNEVKSSVILIALSILLLVAFLCIMFKVGEMV